LSKANDAEGEMDLMYSIKRRPRQIACDDCIKGSTMERHPFDVKRLPFVFVIDLNRKVNSEFNPDTYAVTQEFNRQRFAFPLMLDLSTTSSTEVHIYELSGIICYDTNVNTYFSLIHASSDDANWIKYHATNMLLWDLTRLQDDCFGGYEAPTFAVMLFYKKIVST
jgi:hypothetical protein